MARALLVFVIATSAACAAHVKPVFTAEAPRIWVVQSPASGDEQVYRCADGAGSGELPKPVCVRAAMTDAVTEAK